MDNWLLATFLGLAGVAGMFGLAGLRSYTPRRLAWQDLSRVRKPSREEREMLRTHIKSSMKIYLPILLGAIVLGGFMVADGSPFGLTVAIVFGAPPLLAIVRAIRVLRYLDETA